jgi:hypothetical protein
MKRLLVGLMIVASVGCGLKLSDIVKPQQPPPAVEPPPVEPPVVVAPPPVVEPPAPEVPEDTRPFQNLNVRVFDAANGLPIAGALVENLTDQTHRPSDGNGFANFGVRGATMLRVSARDFATQTRDVPPGNHEFRLVSTLPPPPPPPVQPPPSQPTALTECTKAKNRAFGSVTSACLAAVAKQSSHYILCTEGDGLACHLYVRDVTNALRAGDDEPNNYEFGWGLITKGAGEQGCSTTRCGSNVPGDKYGEDMVAYLNKGLERNLWRGLDIIGGAGAPGARHQSGILPAPIGGRSTNLWAPTPQGVK